MSQFLDSHNFNKKRFIDSSSKLVDPLVMPMHASHSNPIYPVKRRINSQASASLGSTVIYELPRNFAIAEMFVESDWAQTGSADIVPYAGISCIKRVKLLCGSEVLHDYNYKSVISYALSQMEMNAAVRLLVAAGGTACDSTTAAIPNLSALIPTAWSQLLGCDPLLAYKLNQKLTLEITYRSQANCSLSGATGAAISNSKLIVYGYSTDSNLRAKHQKMSLSQKSIDFKTLISSAISTATETDIDCSGLSGNIKKICLSPSLSSEIDDATPVNYFNLKSLNKLVTNIDGDEEIQFLTNIEGILDSLVYNNYRSQNTAIGYVCLVPFNYEKDHVISNKHFTGGLHSSTVNKLQLRVTHTAGANVTIGICGVIDAVFQYNNGGMHKFT